MHCLLTAVLWVIVHTTLVAAVLLVVVCSVSLAAFCEWLWVLFSECVYSLTAALLRCVLFSECVYSITAVLWLIVYCLSPVALTTNSSVVARGSTAVVCFTASHRARFECKLDQEQWETCEQALCLYLCVHTQFKVVAYTVYCILYLIYCTF